MYENEIIEVMNCRSNKKLRQWYDAKVKEVTLLLMEKLESQRTCYKRNFSIWSVRLEISFLILSSIGLYVRFLGYNPGVNPC
ncbi:hypothetical protein ES703_107787 [subsurface metagenome]